VFCRELEGKTRILVTHALDCLPKVDRVIIMNKGKIDYDGNCENLLNTEFYQNIKGSLDSSHMRESTTEPLIDLEDSPKEEEKKEIEEVSTVSS
jgi:ABC-type multidrug transport system ATPase subunit